ncbi:MAG: metallophosphoesterase [Selenomonadaceae bacterium]|nr:metallophosphoesterase [Selenomonadaceae bacterium]
MINFSRRKFLIGGTAFAASAAVSGCFPAYREAAEKLKTLSNGDVKLIRQLVGKTPAERTILFEGLEKLDNPEIELKRPSGETEKISANYVPFTDDNSLRHQYEATLTGLKENESYQYRLLIKGGEGEWTEFKTPAKDKLTALIFPDSQSADYSCWENVAQKAYKGSGDANLYVNMGDLVDNGEDHTQWEAWFRALHGIEEHIPLAPVLGNHECYDNNWKVRLPNAYINYFPTPDNGSENFSRYYYSFDMGPCHFMVLSTEWDETKDFKEGLLDEEQAWLRRDANMSQKPWKIVLMHRDVLQYRIHNRPERKEGISDAGNYFMPLFDELNIDIVFTAHLHTYRNRGVIKNMDRAKNGPYYILTGIAGDVRYPNLWIDHALDVKVAPQPETDNYLVMKADAATVNIKCYKDDGSLIDDVTLNKNNM